LFHEIPNKKITYRFDKSIKPCLYIDSGDYILFNTLDAHNRTVNIEELWADVPFPELDDTNGNPVTGLVYVKGAKPGNLLKVKILEILPDPVGILPVRSYMGIIRDVVNERTARVVKFSNGRLWINKDISISARPMIGTIGIAPEGDGLTTMLLGSHGGNMDDNFITTGSEVYLPIYNKGALLGIGDIHVAMGEGELTCGGADISAHVLVKVEVVKEPTIIKNPFVIKNNLIATHGYDMHYPEAAKMATEEMCKIIMSKLKISRFEAIIMMGARGDLGLCQACGSDILPMVVRIAFPILW